MVVSGFYVIYGVAINRKFLYRLIPNEQKNKMLDERYTLFCNNLEQNIKQLIIEIEEEEIESDLWELIVNGQWLPISDVLGTETDEWISSYIIDILLHDRDVIRQIIENNIPNDEIVVNKQLEDVFIENEDFIFNPGDIFENAFPDNIELIGGPHQVKSTNHDDYALYLGYSTHYGMEPYIKEFPFKDYNKEQKEQLQKFLKDVGYEKSKCDLDYEELSYHILPDDCNCCS